MESRTLVLRNDGQNAPPPAIYDRSEGVRMPFGRLRTVKKVVGVGSLAKFLNKSYRELALILARYIGGRVYGKGTLSTWAAVERRGRMPPGWYAHYWMPDDVADAFKRIIRDYIYWASDGRYAVSVRGAHRWTCTLRRVA